MTTQFVLKSLGLCQLKISGILPTRLSGESSNHQWISDLVHLISTHKMDIPWLYRYGKPNMLLGKLITMINFQKLRI